MHPLTDTAVGARLDRAPCQRRHTTIVLALGAGWLGGVLLTVLTGLSPSIAVGIGAGGSYGLVAAFWLVGAGAMATYTWRGGAEGAGRSLENLAPSRTAPAQLEAA